MFFNNSSIETSDDYTLSQNKVDDWQHQNQSMLQL